MKVARSTIPEEKWGTTRSLEFLLSAQLTIEGVIVQRADCRPVQPNADYVLLKK